MNILIADDHEPLVYGVELLMKRHLPDSTYFKAYDGQQVIDIGLNNPIDLMILDYDMPKKTGSQVIKELNEINYPAKYIILTAYASRDHILIMLDEGAKVIIEKLNFSKHIEAALDAAFANESYFSAFIFEQVKAVHAWKERIEKQNKIVESLTEREKQIICLIYSGLTNKKIAAKLHISLSTVDTHRQNIYLKLDVHKLSEFTKRVAELQLDTNC